MAQIARNILPRILRDYSQGSCVKKGQTWNFYENEYFCVKPSGIFSARPNLRSKTKISQSKWSENHPKFPPIYLKNLR